MRTRILFALAGAIASNAGAVGAQGAPPDSVSRTPTIVLRAEVAAREVRFTKQPELRVTLVGGSVDSVRVLERRNLPERVQAGVTYRDVFVAVEVIGKLHAECLAERLSALGSRLSADSTTAKCDAATGSARRIP